jgi:hypothetical protein
VAPVREIVEGKLNTIKEVEISLKTFLNQIEYVVIALILVLVTVMPNYTIVDGTDVILTTPLSIR